MALDFDSSRCPRNHRELRRLVHAIHTASPADESLWLEWKSTLDLNPAVKGDKSGRAHVARAVIAFANRMPDEAARFAQGHGVLVVGVEPSNLNGVKQHDITELVRWIEPYVGKEVRWSPTYVEADTEAGSVSVLVITIEPPEWGDPICCMRKEAPSPVRDKNIPEAAIFVRTKEGTTRPAKARDLDALTARARQRTPALRLDIEVSAGSIQPVSCSEEQIDAWLEMERNAALGSLLDYQAAEKMRFAYPKPLLLESIAGLTHIIPEKRSPDEFRQEVEEYLQVCRAKLTDSLAEAAAARVRPLSLRVTNNSDSNLERLQIELYIPGDVLALAEAYDEVAANEHFPSNLPVQPRYGPTPSFSFPGIGSIFSASPGLSTPGVHITNGGSATIQLPPVHLRPYQSIDLESFVVISSMSESGPVTGKWTATCTNRDGRYSGQVTLPRAEPIIFHTLFNQGDGDA